MRNINYRNTENSNRIEAIKTTDKGEKLIAFCRVFNYPKCKPGVSTTFLASYKDGSLSIYNRNDFETYNIKTFKEALLFLRKFTNF